MRLGRGDSGVEDLAWRLDAFNKLLLSASPVTSMTAALLREAARVLGAGAGAFLLADRPGEHLRLVAAHSISDTEAERLARVPETVALIERSCASGRPHFAHLPCALRESGCTSAEGSRCEAVLCVPVGAVQGHLAGALFQRFRDPCPREEDFLRIATLLGGSIEIALRSAARFSAVEPGVVRVHPEVGISAAGRLADGARDSSTNPDARSVLEGSGLTLRRRQVLILLGRGLSNKEIATITGLSVFTVRDHVSALLRYLEVPSRAAAIARAGELGLLEVAQKGTMPAFAPTNVGFTADAQNA